VARKPNYQFERMERDRAKAAKVAAKAAAKQQAREDAAGADAVAQPSKSED
jgi:hypothetical protein